MSGPVWELNCATIAANAATAAFAFDSGGWTVSPEHDFAVDRACSLVIYENDAILGRLCSPSP